MFDPAQADLSGMASGAWLQSVAQGTFLDVNEFGTEAAAATFGYAGAIEPPHPEFRADRPFVFLLRDKASGAILLMGAVVEPESDEP